jgi:hypothetical protein
MLKTNQKSPDRNNAKILMVRCSDNAHNTTIWKLQIEDFWFSN